KTLIPLAGMTVGNSMTSTVVVARRVLEELRDKRDEVEARLALGIAAGDAARPYVRAALRTALIPNIETTRAVGLVFLPGAMPD
ncbi:MAG: UDP-glucose/iron transport system permease protein, partial [Acidimicrobiia bacterium]|nr:UDP-glucose/iron transport system permease protein [Acidimicrobiia bacterium]